jgi:hypothetical protein
VSEASYYGQPILKEPVWSWEVPCYFFAGGMAGASQGLAWLSERRGNDVLARRARAAAAVGIGGGTALLISDLGRPERFLNMLRLFKVTSPMSVGSWLLTASGAMTMMAATDFPPGSARAARPAAALLGLPLSTYTAALLTNTAVPVWHEARPLLSPVFASGAALSAGAAGVASTPVGYAAPARRVALAGAACELALVETMHRRLGDLGEVYRQGDAARFDRAAKACIAGGAALLAARGGSSRAAAVTSGALLCAGALSARWSVFKAGFQSVSDPKYVVGPQRERRSARA